MIWVLSIRDYLIVLIANTSHKAHLLSCALRCSSNLQKIQSFENFVSMAIQGTQTHIVFVFFWFFNLFYFILFFNICEKQNKQKLKKKKNKQTNKNIRKHSIKLDWLKTGKQKQTSNA